MTGTSTGAERLKPRYTLVRRLPTGEIKRSGPHLTVSKAITAAGMCLVDNGVASKPEAKDVCLRIIAVRGAEWVEHSSGYAFRVEAAA
jgi:hypothetical protein